MNEKMKKKDTFWAKKAPEFDTDKKGFSRIQREIKNRVLRDTDSAQTILDLGTGTGTIALAMAEHGKRVEAVDVTREMIEIAREKAAASGTGNIRFSVCDASCLDYPDRTFDAVVASNLLHVIDQPEKTLARIRRVLKPSGVLLAPTFLHGANPAVRLMSLLFTAMGVPVRNRFSSGSLQKLIIDAGFHIRSEEIISALPPLSYVTATAPPPLSSVSASVSADS